MVLAQNLRNAVLQAAFNGLLTVRETTDSSVFDLIRQIDEEKRANKSKYYPVSEESEKNVPDSWTITKIGNIIIKDLGGGTPSKNNPKFWNGNIPWMSVKDFSNSKNNILNDTIDHISQEGVDNSATNIIDTNAIILCTRMGLGKFCKITQPIAINQDLRAIWLSKKINESYFIYFYSSLTITGTGTTVKGIKKDELFNHLIPIPPIEEQQRIVDRVNELMKKIDDYEKVEKELLALEQKFPDDMKNALLQAAMQGKLTKQLDSDSSVDEMLEAIKEEKKQLIKEKKIKKEKALLPIEEDDIPFDIPDNWRWERFANIAILNPRNSLDDALEVSFIPMTLISDGYNNEHTAENRIWKDVKKGFTHIKEGDLGFAKITPCFQNRKSVIFKNLVNGYAGGTTELHIIRTISNSILAEYLLWFVKSPYFIDGGVNTYTGTAGQQRIHKDYLPNCLVPVPPIEEQQRIVERLEQLLPLCETL